MDALFYVLVIGLVLITFGLLVFIGWSSHEHRRQIDELTSKLVARSLSEYSASKEAKVTIPEVKKEKKLIDQTLGASGKNW